jgi:hypothetical protein
MDLYPLAAKEVHKSSSIFEALMSLGSVIGGMKLLVNINMSSSE